MRVSIIHWTPSFSLKDNQLFFNIWFLQSIPLFLILTFQPQSKEQCSHTKACKYPHGKCIIISLHSIYYRSFAILIQDKTNQSRYTHQPPVLYPEDQSVSCTQLLFRNNFRNRGHIADGTKEKPIPNIIIMIVANHHTFKTGNANIV